MLELTKYVLKKKELEVILEGIKTLLIDFELDNKVNLLETDVRRLNNEKFHLVVVGEFSRGKSTFVNAMLGQRILPVSKSPTTAVITKIIYGKSPKYTVYYKSGESKVILENEFLAIKAQSEGDVLSLDNLKDKIESSEEQKTLEDISYIEIQYPLSLCKNNVEVIDTPGTNDLNIGRVEITYNYLQKADAAILVLMATQALTKSEMEFLKEQIIGNQISEVFIVINGKDQCKSEDEENRVMTYVIDNLSSVIPHKLKIFLLSSKQALTWRRKENGEELPLSAIKFLPNSIENTGFTTFEDTISRFLDDERGRTKLEKYITRAKGYLYDIEKQMQSQFDSVNHSTDELREQLLQMQSKVRKVKSEVLFIMNNMETRLKSKEIELTNECRHTFMTMQKATVDVLNNCSLDDSPETIKYQIDVAITPIQKQFIESTLKSQNLWIQTEWDKALKDIKTIWSDMDIHFNENIRFTSAFDLANSITSNVDASPVDNDLSIDDAIGVFALGAVTGGLGIGMLAITIAVAGVSIYSDAKEKKNVMVRTILSKLEKSYETYNMNVISNYNTHISIICKKFQDAINARLKDMEQSLSSIIKIKESSEKDASKIIIKLQNKKTVVERLTKELDEVIA